MISLLFAFLFSVSQILGGATLSQNQTKYRPLSGTGSQSGTTTDPTVLSNNQVVFATVFSKADTLSALILQCDKAPTAGQSVSVTVWINGSASNLTATISGSNTSASDYVNTAVIAAGDLVCYKIVTSGSFPFNNNIIYAVEAIE